HLRNSRPPRTRTPSHPQPTTRTPVMSHPHRIRHPRPRTLTPPPALIVPWGSILLRARIPLWMLIVLRVLIPLRASTLLRALAVLRALISRPVLVL
ncbi:hypothetical protein, partial [Nocardia cyriacigeorgica]|uniref:hypothetical protein n=1 Tax=Nocardia cyriacigeorgica TaxID=135487 RepID=UPI001C499C41